MLEQPYRLGLDEANNHIAEHGPNGVESLVCGTDVAQARVIQQNLLNNEDGHRLGQLASRFHNTETEWNDLSGQEESDGGR